MNTDKNIKLRASLLAIAALNLFAFGLFAIVVVSVYAINHPLLLLIILFIFTFIWLYMNFCSSRLVRALPAEETESKARSCSISISNIVMVKAFIASIVAMVVSVYLLLINL